MSALNNSPLLGASGQQGYFLQRSVRLRSSASAYFNRTPASATNRKTWTYSGWVKRGALGANLSVMGAQAASTAGTQRFNMYFDTNNCLNVVDDQINISSNLQFITTQVFRDPSAWYHVVLAMDTTQATSTNRVKLYVNGVQVTAFSTSTYPSLNFDTAINNNVAQYLGYYNNLGTTIFYYDGYETEINLIDGQALTPTSFGAYNATTGVWQPIKYTGTYGTNGFYLNFQDNSAATAAAIGKDSSGNGNNWTPNNISVTAGVTYDSMTDVPTLTNATTANYSTLNPINSYSASLFQGNLNFADGAGAVYQAYSTIVNPDITNNKFYCEVTVAPSYGVCIAVDTKSGSNSNTSRTGVLSYYSNGQKYNDTTATAYGATFTTGDIIGIAMGNGQLEFFKNGVSQGVAFSSLTGAYKFGVWAAGAAGTGCSFNFGQRPFSYTPPTGFVALNTYNLPTPIIANGANQFAATTYTGNGTTQTITNGGNNSIGKTFQPDLAWIKVRSITGQHVLTDSIRGVNKQLFSSLTNAEQTSSSGITSFNSNGFGLGSGVSPVGSTNENSQTYIAWQWKASNAAAVTNTSGSISSQVSANSTAGFSIVTYTGTGANATVGHGLGVAPRLMLFKGRNVVSDWVVYHANIGNTGALILNQTIATSTSINYWNNTSPTSSVFTIGIAGGVNNSSSNTYVAYCFSEIAGYSKFGSYTGNGSADGPFVYCGFRPRYVMIKGSSFVSNWFVIDTSRSSYNVSLDALRPNLDGAEVNSPTTTYSIDILSNGFKLRTSAADSNTSSATFIYACFAENPFSYSLAR